jgi:hypothetical protein
MIRRLPQVEHRAMPGGEQVLRSSVVAAQMLFEEQAGEQLRLGVNLGRKLVDMCWDDSRCHAERQLSEGLELISASFHSIGVIEGKFQRTALQKRTHRQVPVGSQ